MLVREQVIEFLDVTRRPHKHLQRTWFDSENRRNTSQKPLDDCPTCEKEIIITQTRLDEIDRSARAYGWEVGQGHPIVEQLDTTEGNPFMDANWRETHGLGAR